MQKPRDYLPTWLPRKSSKSKERGPGKGEGGIGTKLNPIQFIPFDANFDACELGCYC